MSSSPSSKYSRIHPRNPERGIALISVLWVVLLLSGLAATATYIARTNATLTHRALDLARAQAAADAQIVAAIAKLSDEQPARRPLIGGGAQSWEFEGFSVAVSITEEAGRIDVNAGSDDLILALLQSEGADQDIAAGLLKELRAWQGREQLSPGSRGRPLGSLEELRQIPGWAAHGVDCWMSSLTVYTGLPDVNQADAGTKVLAALQWAQERRLGDRDWIASPSTSALTATRSVLGDVLRIRATASLTHEITTTTEWIGRLTGDRQKPLLTIRWDHDVEAARSACGSL